MTRAAWVNLASHRQSMLTAVPLERAGYILRYEKAMPVDLAFLLCQMWCCLHGVYL